jgi:two-component system sensor histidine kinase KdpD
MTNQPLAGPSSWVERQPVWRLYLLTVCICLATAGLLLPFPDSLDRANIIMVFLLVVLGISVSLGRHCAVLSAVLSVVLFDFAFVPPRFSLSVNDGQYLLTFAVMLVVALTTAQLASGLKLAATLALRREARTEALYALARELAGSVTRDDAVARVTQFTQTHMHVQVWPLLAGSTSVIANEQAASAPFAVETHLATLALNQHKTVASADLVGSGCASTYIPLGGAAGTPGVLAVSWPSGTGHPAHDDVTLLEAVASLLTITLERLHYVEVAHASQLGVAAERLRSSILSTLSHDLRTPLTVLVGLADSLHLFTPPLPAPAQDIAQTIHKQSLQLSSLVGNLLDMARLNAGEVRLRFEWHAWPEVVEASIRYLGEALQHHAVTVTVPPQMPLVEMDAVLMERVVSNLLENAVKYSPPGRSIRVQLQLSEAWAELSVCDEGPGFDPHKAAEMFGLFVRGERESTVQGFGLGLAICRTIVEAHGGRIEADNLPEGGARVRVLLPRGTPPSVGEEI